MDDDRERRMEALRARVQAKKQAGALQEAEELVVSASQLESAPELSLIHI